MLSKRFVVAATAAVCGCAHTRNATHAETSRADTLIADVTDTLSLEASDSLDLSGRWLSGSDSEPSVREIRLQRDCRYTPAAWLLDQRGDSVYAWQMKEQYAKGVAEPPQPRPAMATGRLRGRTLRLSDGANRWVLQYDGPSGHLRGTLNGKPFWAMRQVLDGPTEACIGVP